MNQEDITQIYETLAPMAGDYANAQAERIGMAQQSMGPLAANTMGATTAGLGNYTYNRLMRPQVETMRDEILVQGYANQLNRLLSDALNSARNNYNRNRGGSTTPSTTPDNTGSGVVYIKDVADEKSGLTPTKWTAVPNTYRYEDKDGYMHTVKRPDKVSDADWAKSYENAKKKAEEAGRKFEG